jgi:hypothetical protein
MDDALRNFVSDLEAASAKTRLQGRNYHRATMFLTILALVSGFVAAILASANEVVWYVRAGAAAVPGLCAALLTSLRLQDRAHWSYLLLRQIDALASEVRFEQLPLDQASRRWRQLRLEQEQAYPVLQPPSAKRDH